MKRWIFAFRVEPPTGVISGRHGSNVFFAAYSRALQKWFMVIPGATETEVPEPYMIYVDETWAKDHPRDLVKHPAHIVLSRRPKKPVQMSLF